MFQGNGAGFFAAYSAKDGASLFRAEVGVGIMAPPMTYRIDGEQYVAVLAGLGGSPAINRQNFANDNAGRVFSFKLDGKVPIPPVVARPELAPAKARIAFGRGPATRHHGPAGSPGAGGVLPTQGDGWACRALDECLGEDHGDAAPG